MLTHNAPQTERNASMLSHEQGTGLPLMPSIGLIRLMCYPAWTRIYKEPKNLTPSQVTLRDF
jgi:hypothetical protein